MFIKHSKRLVKELICTLEIKCACVIYIGGPADSLSYYIKDIF